eukprot:SAG31_NODE_5826_length_2306_cov_3.527413_2_plen_399_part_00
MVSLLADYHIDRQGYLRWGNELLGKRQWGDASTIFRAALDSDPRKGRGYEALKQGLINANAGERELRVPSCHDKRFAYALIIVTLATLVLGIVGGANIVPSPYCAEDVCKNNALHCEDQLMRGTFTCDCAPGWGGKTCETAIIDASNRTSSTKSAGNLDGDGLGNTYETLTPEETTVLIGSLLAAAVTSALVGHAWLCIMRRSAKAVLYASVSLAVVGQWCLVVYCAMSGASSVAIMVGLSSFVSLIASFLGSRWVAFVVAEFNAASAVMHAHSEMITVAYVAVMMQLLCGLVLALAIGGVPHPAVYCFLVLAWYWIMQVPVIVAHIAAAGAAASWYFVTREHNPVWNAVKRALTTSIGTIAFGSLLTSLVHSLEFVIMISRRGRHTVLGQFLGGPPV